MAKLIVKGVVADIRLTIAEDEIKAECVHHFFPESFGCGWTKNYDDLRDAYGYSESHADKGDPR